MFDKLKLVLIFGGQNSEHEVSLKTAQSVFENLDQSKYEIRLIYITKIGQWFNLIGFNDVAKIAELNHESDDLAHIMTTLRNSKCLVFPLLHGKYGEDGTIQGFFEMLQIRYIGCGVLSSAVAMDKAVAKKLFQAAGLNVAKSLVFETFESISEIQTKIKAEFKFPIFIKPARQGSSVGISKVYDSDGLIIAIEKAFEFDTKILAESCIVGREVECAVLGRGDQIQASVIGEIRPKSDYYSYASKYTAGQAELIVPAILDEAMIVQIQTQSKIAFKVLNCQDLARVDFFLTAQNDLYLNEINTLPGFTSLSMYPSLWEASGLSFSQLLDTLIIQALN